MRINPVILLLILTAGFVSCQKEYSFENNGTQPVIPGTGQLIRYTLKDDFAVVETNYTYNVVNRVTMQRLSAVAGLFNANIETQPSRNANNQLLSCLIIVKSSLTPGADTLIYTFGRNAAGRLTHYLIQPTDFATSGYDSIVCTYNADNKLATQINYYIEAGTGNASPIQRIELTYNGNNMVNFKDYELNGTIAAATLREENELEYDDKPAAIIVNDDEFLAGLGIGQLGVNNVTKNTVINYDDPDENVTTAYQYTYNGPNGKPSSAIVTTTRPVFPPGLGTATYVYQ